MISIVHLDHRARRRSHGARPESRRAEQDEDSHIRDPRRVPPGNPLGAVGAAPNVPAGPLMINFLQQKDLKSFSNAPGDDPREFIEKYVTKCRVGNKRLRK